MANSPSNDSSAGAIALATSSPAAVIAAIVAGLLCTAHTILLIKHRSWFFHLMVFSALAECTSLVCRALTIDHNLNLLVYCAAYLLPILIPSFMAAACYMVFGRIVWYVTPADRLRTSVLWIPPRWITPLFILFDIGAFCIQFLGVLVIAGQVTQQPIDPDKINTGYSIMKLGVSVQLVCFALFAIIGFRFHFISRKWTPHLDSGRAQRPWTHLLRAFNASATLITLRSIYRIFEFTVPSARVEWIFYAFEVLPLTVVFAIFIWIHPGQCLPRAFTGLRLRKTHHKEHEALPSNYEVSAYFRK